MKCPNCNAEVTGKFCSYCGSEMPKLGKLYNINHNETITNNSTTINNYDSVQEPNYSSIYNEEKMRRNAKEQIESERNTKNFLTAVLIIGGIALFIYWKISSWWSSLGDDGIEPITTDSSVYASIIDISDNREFFESFDDINEDKWYRITGIIESVSNSNVDIYVENNSQEYFAINFEDNVDINGLEENQVITIVGYASHNSSNMIYFKHSILEETDKKVPEEMLQEVLSSSPAGSENEILYPRETDEIISNRTPDDIYNNYSGADSKRWYKLKIRINSITDNSTIWIKDGLPNKTTAYILIYMRPDQDISQYREGDTLTVIGFCGDMLLNMLDFQYCYIVE